MNVNYSSPEYMIHHISGQIWRTYKHLTVFFYCEDIYISLSLVPNRLHAKFGNDFDTNECQMEKISQTAYYRSLWMKDCSCQNNLNTFKKCWKINRSDDSAGAIIQNGKTSLIENSFLPAIYMLFREVISILNDKWLQFTQIFMRFSIQYWEKESRNRYLLGYFRQNCFFFRLKINHVITK